METNHWNKGFNDDPNKRQRYRHNLTMEEQFQRDQIKSSCQKDTVSLKNRTK